MKPAHHYETLVPHAALAGAGSAGYRLIDIERDDEPLSFMQAVFPAVLATVGLAMLFV